MDVVIDGATPPDRLQLLSEYVLAYENLAAAWRAGHLTSSERIWRISDLCLAYMIPPAQMRARDVGPAEGLPQL
jgi:hypothetical protein